MEEGLAKVPKLDLAQYKYVLIQEATNPNPNKAATQSVKEKLLAGIVADNMTPFYSECCKDLGWPTDKKLEETMKAANEEKLKELDSKIEDAEKNLGETEIRETNLLKAEYFSLIGSKDLSLEQFRKTYEKTVTLGHRLDIVFHQIRLGFFYHDFDLIKRNLDKAKSLIEEGGDWDRRNRLKVYLGLYSVMMRDFKTASAQFLDTVATFTSYELMDYETFVIYTIFSTVVALSRTDLRDKVSRNAEILEVLHGLPQIKNYLFSIYECRYADFFKSLAYVEQYMRMDRYFEQHYNYYIREMRIIAYNQLLESYSSLTLTYMASSFGVSNQFIDKELSRFIAAGRLHCKIDRVKEIVETNRPDNKNYQYQETIKKGDLLLNRIQKLSRVINI
jgi:26S proteasome regulatory subunit N7